MGMGIHNLATFGKLTNKVDWSQNHPYLMVENKYMYQVFIIPTSGLNFLMKFCRDDTRSRDHLYQILSKNLSVQPSN